MREQVSKPLQVSIRQQGAHFRVVYQHKYPQVVEEVVYTERFATTADAQKFVDDGLRAAYLPQFNATIRCRSTLGSASKSFATSRIFPVR